MKNEIDCKRAFEIACELLNDHWLFGWDREKIFEKMMEKDGVISSKSYERFILENLDYLTNGGDAEMTNEDVKAFEAEKQKPCEDCISRQAAIDAIKKIHPVDTEYDCTLYDEVDVMYVLSDLPSVTSQQKIGRWIFHKPFDNGRKNCNGCIECSQCHVWLGYDCYAKTLYCPNCGSRMEAENE